VLHNRALRNDMTLIADVMLSDIDMVDSRLAVRQVAQNLYKVHRRYLLPAQHLQGVYTGDREYDSFMPSRRNVNWLRTRFNRVHINDADSIARSLAADILLNRLIMLCRDMPPDILQMLHSFRRACREKEIRNVEREEARRDGLSRQHHVRSRKAHGPAQVARDLPPNILRGEKCSPWKCAQVLAAMARSSGRGQSRDNNYRKFNLLDQIPYLLLNL